jgi:hypothetical protein
VFICGKKYLAAAGTQQGTVGTVPQPHQRAEPSEEFWPPMNTDEHRYREADPACVPQALVRASVESSVTPDANGRSIAPVPGITPGPPSIVLTWQRSINPNVPPGMTKPRRIAPVICRIHVPTLQTGEPAALA